MVIPARPEVESLPPSIHGGVDLAEIALLEISRDAILDFSTNINPLGPPPGLRKALVRGCISRYPDRSAVQLRAAIAEHLNVHPEQVLVGNGASQIIELVGLAYIRPGTRILILGPTYGEYERIARLMGGQVVWQWIHPKAEPPKVEVLGNAWESARPHLVFLCNPNNPTGVWLDRERLFAQCRRRANTLFVMDESYIHFVEPHLTEREDIPENVVLIRSLTKDFALAGLRLGYAVASQAIVERLARCQPPWSINAMAQAAGMAIFTDPSAFRWLAICVNRLRRYRDWLRRRLDSLGLRTLPSATHFFLVHVGNAHSVRKRLLRNWGILVRDCASFGLPEWIRLAPLRPKANRRLVQAFRAMRVQSS